jgi:hypothetical protein
MKNGRMQCKDIPTLPVLEFLAKLERMGMTGCSFEGAAHSVLNAMPPGVNFRFGRAKMAMLIRAGLSTGCACGCRGDFELTTKGRAAIQAEDRT